MDVDGDGDAVDAEGAMVQEPDPASAVGAGEGASPAPREPGGPDGGGAAAVDGGGAGGLRRAPGKARRVSAEDGEAPADRHGRGRARGEGDDAGERAGGGSAGGPRIPGDPRDTGGETKEAAKAETGRLRRRLAVLQEKLYADGRYALLIVLQGMDASGKDGVVRHVFRGVNPQGVRVHSFKQPTPRESAQDFLWRVHQAVPPKGMIGIFNRSHYEDVLVVRVHGLVPEGVWRSRYARINDFEHLLAESGVRILKFCLHISKEEQRRRFDRRLLDARRHWKFSPDDLRERQHWAEYQRAYAEMLEACATPHAPWTIVPADHKWYRNLVVGRAVVAALEEMRLHYPQLRSGPGAAGEG